MKGGYHYFELEPKIQSKQLKHWLFIHKEVDCWQGDGFCLEDSKSVIMIDYLEKEKY